MWRAECQKDASRQKSGASRCELCRDKASMQFSSRQSTYPGGRWSMQEERKTGAVREVAVVVQYTFILPRLPNIRVNSSAVFIHGLSRLPRVLRPMVFYSVCRYGRIRLLSSHIAALPSFFFFIFHYRSAQIMFT